MNNLSIKIVSVLVILLFCLSPLGAIDLNQENNATHGNICKGADFKDVNSTIDSDKLDPDLKVSVNDTLRGDEPMVQVNAHKLLNGTANLKLKNFNGTNVTDTNVPIVNGVGNWTIENYLNPGNYSIVANFTGDNNFTSSVKSANFTVSDKCNLHLSVSVDNISIDEMPIVKIKAHESFNKNVTVKLKSDTSYMDNKIELVNGIGNLTIEDELSPGSYSVVANFSGDDIFNASMASTIFTIKLDPGLSVSADDICQNEKPLVHVKVNESINAVKVKLEKSDGTCVADTNVALVNGVGNWTIEDELSPGSYSVVANFTGDTNFNGSVKSANFTVSDKHNSRLTVNVDDISVGERPVVHVRANESLNGTVDVKLKFKGSDFIITGTRLKLVDGEGNLTIGTILPQGDYSLFVTFSGDDTFIRNNKTAGFSVKS